MKNRILIVEDDRGIADAVALSLKFAGYDCLAFDDGAQAAAHLAQDRAFDLALLDVMVPGEDGFALSGRLARCGVPVIFITARADAASEIRGLRGGAEDYIVKPFDMMALLLRIEKALRRTGRLNAVYRVRDVALNSETHVVTPGGEEVELQPLEYGVLLALLRHKNMTVSREQLLQEVWGYDYAGETRAVDVKISGLRKKLGLGDAIRSVPKLGYRLEER